MITHDFDGWVAVDPTLQPYSYSFHAYWTARAYQFMDRPTLDARLAVTPALTPPPATAIVADGSAIVVHDLSDAAVAGSPGVAHVAAGVLAKVNLTV